MCVGGLLDGAGVISQRTTDADKLNDLVTLRDSLLAHLAKGEGLLDVVHGLNRAIAARMERMR